MKAIVWITAGLVALSSVVPVAAELDRPGAVADARYLYEIGEMSVARAAHQATVLDSGHVLISGGCSGDCDTKLQSAELYNPDTRSFRPAGKLATARDSHAAILLKDGRVLIAGGWAQRDASNRAELYQPESNRFVNACNLTVARAAPTATLLRDGRVLLTGGQNSKLEPLASTELYDPASAKFSPAASMSVARMSHVAVPIANGKVLIIGGRSARRGEILRTAELFDPSTGQFKVTGDMASPRHKLAAVLLADGRVLVLGGSDSRDDRGRYRSTEIYNPATGTFSAGPDMQWPRFKIRDAVVVLASGAVLAAGGASRLELLEPGSKTFVPVSGELSEAREFATASVLLNGEVLVLGGYDHQIRTSASAWLVGVR